MTKYSLPYPLPLKNPHSPFRNFNYIRPIHIKGSTQDLRDYQVKIVLNSNNFPLEKCKPDGSDIRFRDETGQPLPYWIESWNSEEAIVWCKISYIPANRTKTTWLIYGNPAALSESNGANVFEQFNVQDVVAFWHLDESQWTGAVGEVKDETGNDHGTAYNGADTTSTAKYKRAGLFDGTDDYVFIPNYPDLDITDKVTIEAWAKSAVAGQKNCIIVGTQSPNSATHRHYFGFDSNGRLGIGVGNEAWNNEGNNYTLDTNWHFYSFVTDGDTHKIYVDGQYRGAKVGVLKPSTNAWFIGANHFGTSFNSPFNGIIDEVCIYHRALTDTEIKIHYNYYMEKIGSYFNVRKYATPEPVVIV